MKEVTIDDRKTNHRRWTYNNVRNIGVRRVVYFNFSTLND